MKGSAHELGFVTITLERLQLCAALALVLGCSICPRAKEKERKCSCAHLARMSEWVRHASGLLPGASLALNCGCWLLLVTALDYGMNIQCWIPSR